MQGFQDLFVAALSALVVACVIAKFVSVVFYDSKVKVKVKVDDDDDNKVVRVVENVNLGNAFKVRGSRTKKRVKFVDHVVVKHVDQLGFEDGGEEIKRVVFSGEEKGLGYAEGMIGEGKTEKDDVLKCVDEQKVDEEGRIVLGRSDELSGEDIGGKKNDFDQHLTTEEVNVTIRGNIENVELFNNLGVKEENMHIGGICDFIVEEEVIKEEASTSGSVLGCLTINESMNKESFSSPSYVDFVNEHARLDKKEDKLMIRLGGNTEGGLSEMDGHEDRVEVVDEIVEGGLRKKVEARAMKNENVVIDGEDDDWEGIERTELEKVFAEAVNYVEFGEGKADQLAKLGRDVQMQLYGLHKIAVEGSCHQAQPMALNFFARSKWNAWQKLGSMSSEDAMEEYIKLLTEHFPDWVQHFYDMTSTPHQEDRGQSSIETGVPHGADYNCTLQDIQPTVLLEPVDKD